MEKAKERAAMQLVRILAGRLPQYFLHSVGFYNTIFSTFFICSVSPLFHNVLLLFAPLNVDV